MTTILACVMDKGAVRILDRDKLAKWKKAHKQGEAFDMILDDGGSSALTPLAKRYFATRDEYAAVLGYSKPYAHVELKHLYGVTYPADAAPTGRLVRLVDAYGELEWQLSIVDYTHEELTQLVMGAEVALTEAGV